MYPTPEFLRVWKGLVDQAPNASWLLLHEEELLAIAWQVWKMGRERMPSLTLQLQRA